MLISVKKNYHTYLKEAFGKRRSNADGSEMIAQGSESRLEVQLESVTPTT